MLQQSESIRMRRQPPVLAVTSKRSVAPKSSALDRKITAFRAAHRAVQLATANFDALCRKHPNLVPDCEPILIYTNGEGKPVYGRSSQDIERVYPPECDHFSLGNVRRRAELQTALTASYSSRKDERKRFGYSEAHNALYKAAHARKQLFLSICRHRPATLTEARAVSKVVRSFLPKIAKDFDNHQHSIFGYAAMFNDYDGWKEARVDAFDYLAALTLSFCEAGGR